MKGDSRTTITLLATLICFGVAGFVLYRYRNPSPPGDQRVTLAGDAAPRNVTEEMPIEEAGSFAGPSYLTARQQHLSNREAYRQLASVPAPASVADARALLKPLVLEATEREPVTGLQWPSRVFP